MRCGAIRLGGCVAIFIIRCHFSLEIEFICCKVYDCACVYCFVCVCECLFVSVVILLTDFKLEQSHSHMLVFSFIANLICMRIPSVGLFIARAEFFTFYLFFNFQ